MRVLHVIPSLSPLRGGPTHAALAMVLALREMAMDAEIASTNDHGAGVLDVPLGQRIEYQDVPVWFFGRFSPPIPTLREFIYSRGLSAWLCRHIDDYDLLHIHAIFCYPATAAMWMARKRQKPYISRPLGQLDAWALQQSAVRKKLYWTLIEKRNLQEASAIHFTAERERTEATRLGLNAPSVVIPHGVDIPANISNARARLRDQLGLPYDEPIILFLSRVHPKKGLDYLIPALGKLKGRRFSFILAGTGDPSYEAEVARFLRLAEIEDRTKRVGFVEGEFKQLLLQGSDLFVLTSHSENFGIAVIEALAADLPVLITPSVALADTVSSAGFGYVVKLDATHIAEAIDAHLRKADRLEGSPARTADYVAAHYSWSSVAQKLRALYEKVCSKSLLSHGS